MTAPRDPRLVADTRSGSASVTCSDPYHCITCSDEGIAMRVVDVNNEFGSALCVHDRSSDNDSSNDSYSSNDGAASKTAPTAQEILTALIENVQPGDVLLVHAGTAIARLASIAGQTSPSTQPVS